MMIIVKQGVMCSAICFMLLILGCSPEMSQEESGLSKVPEKFEVGGPVECKTIDFLCKGGKRIAFRSLSEIKVMENKPQEERPGFDITGLCYTFVKPSEKKVECVVVRAFTIPMLRLALGERVDQIIDMHDAISKHYQLQVPALHEKIDNLLRQGYVCVSAPKIKTSQDAYDLTSKICFAIAAIVDINRLTIDVWGRIVHECEEELADNEKLLDEVEIILKKGKREK